MKTSITKRDIDDIIERSDIRQTKLGDKTTCVTLITPEGFEITETSACVDPANYNEIIGYDCCMAAIRKRLWELEGYRLQHELAMQAKASPAPVAMTNKEHCDRLRTRCKELEMDVRNTIKGNLTERVRGVNGPQYGLLSEAIAQAMLAVRHLEDARMRIGKVIQYADAGGVSTYDTQEPAK